MSTSEVGLGTVRTWFPECTSRIEDLPCWDSLDEADRRRAAALGVVQVHRADGLDEVDLAARAARRVLQDADLPAASLDAVLLVQGRAPRYLLASDATRLQFLLGADRALTFGVGDLGCVSVSAALTVAAALLRSGGHRRVLLAMGSVAAAASRYRAPMTLLGDGGAALLLTAGGGEFVLADHEVQVAGRYSDLFRIDYRDVPAAEWREVCDDPREYSFRLALESRSRLRELNDAVLARNDLKADAIDAVIMQNLALGAFTFWEDALGVTLDPACRTNLAGYGHLGSIDVLLNLRHATERIPAGGHALLMNSSPVAAWSTTLLRRAGGHPASTQERP